jgi:trans-aconitate 2-methyltransferase
VLAVQMPRNSEAPSHALLREVAGAGPWAARLAPRFEAEPVAAPEWYRDLLAPLTAGLDIWQTEYLHVLDGEDPVLNWVRGSALRPVTALLSPDEQARFEDDYARRLRAAYPRDPNGRTPFAFRRLFIVAAL